MVGMQACPARREGADRRAGRRPLVPGAGPSKALGRKDPKGDRKVRPKGGPRSGQTFKFEVCPLYRLGAMSLSLFCLRSLSRP